MKQVVWGFFLIILFGGTYSCNRECPTGDCPFGYQSYGLYYYDSNLVKRSDMQYFYLYELDASGKTIHKDKVANEINYIPDDRSHWNMVCFYDFYKIGNKDVSNKTFIVTLKDSTFPVKIEKMSLRYMGGSGCNKCDDYYMDSLKINGKEYKREELPIKIN